MYRKGNDGYGGGEEKQCNGIALQRKERRWRSTEQRHSFDLFRIGIASVSKGIALRSKETEINTRKRKDRSKNDQAEDT